MREDFRGKVRDSFVRRMPNSRRYRFVAASVNEVRPPELFIVR